MTLNLTVHIDSPELGLDEELEGGRKVMVGLPLAVCLTKYTFFIKGPRSYRPQQWS